MQATNFSITKNELPINLSKFYNKDNIEKISYSYLKKELEWIKLVGKERWFALDPEKRDFLIRTAGIIEINGFFDIREAFRYYE